MYRLERDYESQREKVLEIERLDQRDGVTHIQQTKKE